MLAVGHSRFQISLFKIIILKLATQRKLLYELADMLKPVAVRFPSFEDCCEPKPDNGYGGSLQKWQFLTLQFNFSEQK
jgi:hypothetical protein